MLYLHIVKNYCHIRHRKPQICLLAKFHEKTKLPKPGPKNVSYFGIFGHKF